MNAVTQSPFPEELLRCVLAIVQCYELVECAQEAWPDSELGEKRSSEPVVTELIRTLHLLDAFLAKPPSSFPAAQTDEERGMVRETIQTLYDERLALDAYLQEFVRWQFESASGPRTPMTGQRGSSKQSASAPKWRTSKRAA